MELEFRAEAQATLNVALPTTTATSNRGGASCPLSTSSPVECPTMTEAAESASDRRKIEIAARRAEQVADEAAEQLATARRILRAQICHHKAVEVQLSRAITRREDAEVAVDEAIRVLTVLRHTLDQANAAVEVAQSRQSDAELDLAEAHTNERAAGAAVLAAESAVAEAKALLAQG